MAKNFNSLLAARVVISIAGAKTEALGAVMVNVRLRILSFLLAGLLIPCQDIFFLHEHGQKMGIYIVFLGAGSSLGPLCAGYIVNGRMIRRQARN